MTRDQIIALIQQRAGDRDDLGTPCLLELPLIQESILEGNSWLPWFCEVDLQAPENSLPVGAQFIDLPADYLLDKEDSHIWLIRADGSKKVLNKYTQDKLRATYALNGEPAAYAIHASTIEFRPFDLYIEYTLEWRYMGRQIPIDLTPGESPWTKHAADVVLNELGALVAGRYTQNAGLEQAFRAGAETAWHRLLQKHVAREEMNRDSRLEN